MDAVKNIFNNLPFLQNFLKKPMATPNQNTSNSNPVPVPSPPPNETKGEDDLGPGKRKITADEDEDSPPEPKSPSKDGNDVSPAKRKRTEEEDDDSDDSEEDADFVPDPSQYDEEDEDEEFEDRSSSSNKQLSAEEVAAQEKDEKAETDRLWADFLNSVEADKARKNKKERTVEKVVNKTYDFAGEKVSVQEKVKVTVSGSSNSNGVVFKVPTRPVSSPSTSVVEDGQTPGPSSAAKKNGGFVKPAPPPPKKRRGGISILGNDPEAIGLDELDKRGLSGLLKAFKNKATRLGTLEKSKLDWEAFKRKQGLEEELHHHNRSRDTYIDKQEFLQRTDHRQFEIEKNMRATARSRRLAN